MGIFFTRKKDKKEEDNYFQTLKPIKEDEETAETESVELNNNNEEWLDEDYEEGQLSVDVFQTDRAIVIKSTIAGVKPEDIDISINDDMITIRGKREVEENISQDDYFYQECYWGGFSRSIILPMVIRPEKAEASLKNGVLTVVLPKAGKDKSVTLKVKNEDEEE